MYACCGGLLLDCPVDSLVLPVLEAVVKDSLFKCGCINRQEKFLEKKLDFLLWLVTSNLVVDKLVSAQQGFELEKKSFELCLQN